jgi:adenylate cyclase
MHYRAMTLLNAQVRHIIFVHQDAFLNVGMGISTGYVTVGNIGSPARQEYTVYGNHVNLAARLCQCAKANQILVSERTLVLARNLVDATQVDQLELKGVSRPLKTYEINEKRGQQL